MIRIKILLLLFTFVATSYSQEMLKHEKRFYVSPDGKLYVQKSRPIYIWLSDSPSESSKKYRLQSESTARYTNPLYFDTEGYNTVRTPSCVDTITRKAIYPQQDIIFEIYADSESPRTKISYNGAKTYKKDGKVYVGSAAKIELTSKDALSGVEQILYSIDGAAFKKYDAELPITEEKEYILKYYSVDNVGNVEALKEITIVFDKTSPITKIIFDGDKFKDVLSGTAKISFEADDKGIGLNRIMYKIDDNQEKQYKYPINTAYLKQGEHTIVYKSYDNVNNVETEKSYTFYVDKTAPTIIEEVEGKSFFANGKEYSSGRARLKLTALDNKAGVKEIKYSINGGEYQVYEKPVNLTMASGNLVIKSFAVDNVNNSSQSKTANQAAEIPYIDLSGPKLTHGYSGPVFNFRDTVFISAKTKIALKARDSESGIYRIDYQINDGDILNYESPFTINKEGLHTVKFTGYDNVENSSTNTFMVRVDSTGPVIDYKLSTSPSTGKDTYPQHVILFLSSTDYIVGLEKVTYNINNSAQKIYTSPISRFSVGNKTLKVKAYDKLQNVTEKSITFTVE